MDATLCDALSKACSNCSLGGGCCIGAMPPLTDKRIEILLANGVRPDSIEIKGYKRLRLKPDGFCVLFHDVKGTILQIFLKKPSICPMVELLKKDRKAYEGLFELSVSKIVDLVNGLPPEELAEIVKIEEPETELVAEIKLTR